MSKASLETKRYLDKIGTRVRMYHTAIDRAKDYCVENEIVKQAAIINCVAMACLWVAAIREEVLSEEDLFLFLGLETELAEQKTMALHPDMATWSLEEVLDYVSSTS
jgi:hypothetical protein